LTGAAASVLVVLTDALLPSAHLSWTIRGFMDNIDFKTALLNVMLLFLLFAGALHIDLREMCKGKWLIAIISTAGVLVSTVLVAVGFKALTFAFGIDAPFIWCLVFGALISPTHPVAVIARLHHSVAPKLLKTTPGTQKQQWIMGLTDTSGRTRSVHGSGEGTPKEIAAEVCAVVTERGARTAR
jgi:CPA1 family monovalent cation:H+ antiporter